MTIRTRLALWYTGVLLMSFLLMAVIIYYEFVVERADARAAGVHHPHAPQHLPT